MLCSIMMILVGVGAHPWDYTSCTPISRKGGKVMGKIPSESVAGDGFSIQVQDLASNDMVLSFSKGGSYKVAVTLDEPSLLIFNANGGKLSQGPDELVGSCGDMKWSSIKESHHEGEGRRLLHAHHTPLAHFEFNWTAPETDEEVTFTLASAPKLGEVKLTKLMILATGATPKPPAADDSEEEGDDEEINAVFFIPIGILVLATAIITRVGGKVKHMMQFSTPYIREGGSWFNPLVNRSKGQVISIVVFLVTAFIFAIIKCVDLDLRKGTGWVCTLTLTILVTPINRRSLWLYVARIPYDRAVWAHRIMGRTFVLLVCLHFLVTLSTYGFAVFTLFGLESPVVAWFGLVSASAAVIMGLTSIEYVRRSCFEVFKYIHLALVGVVYLFALLHNSDELHVGLLLLPVALTILDYVWTLKVLKTKRDVLAVSLFENVVRVEVEKKGMVAEAGQFCWINIPEISKFQWHPYTMSSAPCDNTITFHIKGMGEGSWSQHLVNMCAQDSEEDMMVDLDTECLVSEQRKLQTKITIKMDGPYGRLTMAPQAYRRAILIGGGIGVTPMMSLFKHLMHCADTKAMGSLQKVTLVFTTQHESEQDSFLSVMEQATQYDGFEVDRYETRSDPDTNPSSHGVFQRRPDLSGIIDNAVMGNGAPDVCVYVCGPPSMINTVRASCTTLNVAIHTETFLF